MGHICITPADMTLFSAVSHDINPLHASADYARRTPFGEPVVFGILGALASMQHTPSRPAQALSKASLLFSNPLYVGIDYRVVVESADTEDRVEVLDGRRRMIECTFTYCDLAHPTHRTLPSSEGVASQTVPAEWGEFALTDQLSASGEYMPPSQQTEQLIARWQLNDKGITPAQVGALAWTSYIVGMEIPGKQAAYSRLEMNLTAGRPGPTAYRYVAKLVRRDPRFNLLRLAAQLRDGAMVVADAQIAAFVRSDSRACSFDALEELLPPSQALQGKVALVIGGSRGLGAALVGALASQGCTVFLNYARSQREAKAIRDGAARGSGEVRLLAGDAADYRWCKQQRETIAREFDGLDFLICNASPAIQPLDFTADTLDRFHQFVDQSLRLVTAPLAAFSEPLKSRDGLAVIISSVYAKTAPAEFPHYVAAKAAIEGLIRSISTHKGSSRCVMVRPPKLLTDQTNTPLGKKGAVIPERIAAKVVSALLEEPSPGEVQILEDFEG